MTTQELHVDNLELVFQVPIFETGRTQTEPDTSSFPNNSTFFSTILSDFDDSGLGELQHSVSEACHDSQQQHTSIEALCLDQETVERTMSSEKKHPYDNLEDIDELLMYLLASDLHPRSDFDKEISIPC